MVFGSFTRTPPIQRCANTPRKTPIFDRCHALGVGLQFFLWSRC